MNIIDCHTHTQFSVDSEADVNACIARAAELGLAAYAITDHCECNRWYSKEHYPGETVYPYFDFGRDFESSVSAVTELKKAWEGRLNLICGVELGQATHDFDVAERVVADERLDFVLGSMHQLPKTEDFCFIDYTEFTLDEIYGLCQRYFEEILKLCRWGKFDILSHLTYFLRYIKGGYGIDLDISRFDELIAESFRQLIAKDKGIEINTSGLRQGFGDTFPDIKYVRLFKDLGGELLSLGSDSHTVADIGANIADGAKIAAEAGFTRLAYFKKRRPYFINID
ncbi:MAG: histidinol-phosphatase HisJ family protein [Ruminococcus sp.]|nr:histidinol-phosphatase HisJ family protein [Ruminococcus sp.]